MGSGEWTAKQPRSDRARAIHSGHSSFPTSHSPLPTRHPPLPAPPCRHGHRPVRRAHVPRCCNHPIPFWGSSLVPNGRYCAEPPVNPMRVVAEEAGLDVFAPESINSPEAHAWLRDKSADLLFATTGKSCRGKLLALLRLGGINLARLAVAKNIAGPRRSTGPFTTAKRKPA